MKKAWTLVSISALILTISFAADAKISKQQSKAFQQECKTENPGAKKKELRKCVKEKARAAK